MNNKFMTLTVLAGLFATSVASANIVCTSTPNATGGTVSVIIGENSEGQPTVSLFAQGGRAHFVSSEGPFVATAQHEPDGTFYSFEDNFGQSGEVAIITSTLGGKLQTTATANFGMWKDATMYCK